jgi:hypothetical protein
MQWLQAEIIRNINAIPTLEAAPAETTLLQRAFWFWLLAKCVPLVLVLLFLRWLEPKPKAI